MIYKYKIVAEDNILTVMKITECGIYYFYFGYDLDEISTVQEMYDLLSGAGLDVEIVEFEDDNS